MKYFATGPFSFWVTIEHDYCEKSWWKNLIYMQNFWPEEQCLGVTWYLGNYVPSYLSRESTILNFLANDWQFFIISPPIIWSLWRFPIVGLVLSGLLTLAGKR